MHFYADFGQFFQDDIFISAIENKRIYGYDAAAMAFRFTKSFSTLVIHTLCKSSLSFLFFQLHLCKAIRVQVFDNQ